MPFDVSKYARVQSIILPETDDPDDDDDCSSFDPEDVELIIGHQEYREEDEDEELLT